MQPESKNYLPFLEELKNKIEQAQLKAVLSVNSQMIQLYWSLGTRILQEQAKHNWGAKIIDKLAKDLQMTLPNTRGLSARNLKYMRAFAEAYTDFEFVQRCVAQISWRHNIAILTKLKDFSLREWYAQKAIENGWSKDVMVHQIEGNLHKNIGNLPNNFKTQLPIEQAELVQHLLKDEYLFDFIAQDKKLLERELENELVQNITKFLLELGKGFAFVGRQYRLEVGGQDFYIDMLFYHFKIKCFVVVELKVDEFKPEFAGKLNFYLSAVDDLVRQKEDNPTIGLLLCKYKNNLVVEFALRDVNKPMGVASYQLTKQIPESLKENLPTEEELKTIFELIDFQHK